MATTNKSTNFNTMNKITQIGLIALVSAVLFAAACKKNASNNIYNSWTLTDVQMPNLDSVALSQMKAADVVYTFSKDGSYSYNIQGTKGGGTFSINYEGTQITTTEEGQTETLDAQLSETSLTLSKGPEKMMFTVKK